MRPPSLFLLALPLLPLTMSQPPQPPALDHRTNVYLAVTHSSSFSPNPALAVQLTARDQPLELAHVEQVGALEDVQLYAIPRGEWDELGEAGKKEVLREVRDMEGVRAVEEQVLRQRVKRDEF